MQLVQDKAFLYAALNDGGWVITPTNRASESLLQDYFWQQQQQSISKPKCFPYSFLLRSLYDDLCYSHPDREYPLLLTNNLSTHLWQRIIKNTSSLAYSEGLVAAVSRAWEICALWQVNIEGEDFQYTAQTREFQHWCQQYISYLEQENLLAEPQLVPFLIQQHFKCTASSIIWLCFDDYTPQQRLLQEYFTQLNIPQWRYEPQNRPDTDYSFAADNQQLEYEQLQLWLNRQLEATNNRIGVVVPDLQQRAASLLRYLTQEIPDTEINISLGKTLSNYPIVAHALCWLQLSDQDLNSEEITLLLQSPYLIAGQQEFNGRSQILQNRVSLLNNPLELHQLIKILEPSAPRLANTLMQLAPYPAEASIASWIELFQQRLNAIGFPGESALDSLNYQCVQRFLLVFDEFRQFTLFYKTLKYEEALMLFKQLLNSIIFQAQNTGARIHLSGVLEASGLEFDALWFMGLTDQTLPHKVNLSAFIPTQLQKDLSMPYSSIDREFFLAQNLITRLQHSAAEVVFSYPRLVQDQHFMPCTLLKNLPSYTPIEKQMPPWVSPLIEITETYLLPLSLTETVTGGTALLANQAKCPFKAFAEHRLRVRGFSDPEEGLDARTRGQIVHKIMEQIWTRLEKQEALFTLSENELEQLIVQSLETLLAALTQEHPELGPIGREVEFLRLKRLIYSCLEWEKNRPPFRILALEQSYTVELGGLKFEVRIDRLDQVADKKWVIDYKSSLPSTKPWNEDRPREPQLLLYALLDEQINTLLFLQLKNGQVCCSGLSEDKHPITGLGSLKKERSWESYRDDWQAQLESLAQEFSQGICMPKPLTPALCTQCDFSDLCRIHTLASDFTTNEISSNKIDF